MSLQITEKPNKLMLHNSKNNLDHPLCKDLPEPLPNYSGFSMVIIGASGSGKTTALYSMMSAKKKNGMRQSYLKCFHKIYVVSPTIANNSIKNDPFKKLPENQIHRKLTLDVLEELEEEIQKNREEGLNSAIIFDDVGSQLRKSAAIDKKLTQMIQNRRHDYTSYFILLQKYRDAGTGIRNNISHFMTFKPKNRLERESIINELLPFKQNKSESLLNYVFENDDKFSFLFVDMSLKKTNKFKFYKKFNELELQDIETGIKN
jgi:ABC-type dipeptide/oligopeptide/nickel transport system ATPase component